MAWTATPTSAINAICDAETGVDNTHEITVSSGQTNITGLVQVTVVSGAGPLGQESANVVSLTDAESKSGTPYSHVFEYPASGRANKGVDYITVTVTVDGTAVTDSPFTITKTWEKGVIYQQADGTWSTEAQDEDQAAGMASNTVGQGRGIVTPHKDIVVLYPEYVLEFVDALIASGKQRASELGTACGVTMSSLAQGIVLKKNYHGITTPTGATYNAGLVPAVAGEYVNDIVITPTTPDAVAPLGSPLGVTGYSKWFIIDDVCCVIGAVIDCIIWYPITGYNPQIGDYLCVLDKAGNSMLKWPLASNNPQLRMPLLLRGHETIITDISSTQERVCEYGKYRFKIKLAVPVSRDHKFRIEWAGIKIVTVESQIDACETVTKQTPQSQESDLCHESC